MKIIGLTGGIASGKSTVARLFREAGVPVIDADQLAREIVLPGTPALNMIKEHFGDDICQEDGTLDRKKLASIIFADSQQRQILNQITHPRVAMLALERFQELAEEGHAIAVYEVPLLFENQLQSQFDATVLVAVDEETQIQRLRQRDLISEADAKARIQSQMPLAQKRSLAQFVIENGTDLHSLQTQVENLLKQLRN